jgi:TRAP-type C4-dicarboxylate transport system substrate-binding protein
MGRIYGKSTKGKIKIDVYDNETLLKSSAIWNGVITGVADMVMVVKRS